MQCKVRRTDDEGLSAESIGDSDPRGISADAGAHNLAKRLVLELLCSSGSRTTLPCPDPMLPKHLGGATHRNDQAKAVKRFGTHSLFGHRLFSSRYDRLLSPLAEASGPSLFAIVDRTTASPGRSEGFRKGFRLCPAPTVRPQRSGSRVFQTDRSWGPSSAASHVRRYDTPAENTR
jgi:hypothetical protein